MHKTMAYILAALLGGLWSAPTCAQPASGPDAPTATQPGRPLATAPASQPPTAESLNPLRSPRSTMEHFLSAARAAREAPERIAGALLFLDFSQVDAEVAREQAPDLARQLGEILEYLIKAGRLSPEALPDDPAAETQVIGHDPLLLVLERRAGRVWQFSPSTVAEVPRLHALLAPATTQATSAAAEPEPAPAPVNPAVPDGLRSPRALVTQFLVALREARDDPERYADVLACLNFAAVGPQTAEERGPEYAENLGEILQRLLDEGRFRLEDLPDAPDAEPQTLGQDPLLVILTRDEAGRWLFASRTVAQIPVMHARLKAVAESAPATEEPGAAKPVAAPVPPAGVPAEFRSPRAAMETFLRAMSENDLRTAARCLDLSDLKPAERDANAHLLAGKLLLVMRRYEVVVLQRIPDEPELEGPYKYLISRYGRIELERQVAGDRDGEWLFSATTVSSIERLYKGWETRPVLPELRDAPGLSFFTLPALWLREHIIPPYLKRAALGLQYWQWLGAALVLMVGVLVQRIARVILPWVARRLLPAREFTLDPNLLRPITLLALVATWWGGIQLLDLGAKATGVLWPALRLVLIVLGAWALYRLIDLLSGYSVARPRRGETRLNDVLVPLVRKTLKVVIVAVGATMVLTAVGFEVGPLLAGLGLGGLAFSFAAKDTIANFFGSVNVVLDRPFQVGDYVKIGNHEGTVESVGLRSSRLRTFHDSQLTIPNAELMTAAIDNLGRRRYRRTHATLTVSHAATPEQLEAFCEGIRELIRRHPHTRKENYHVSVSALMATAVEITLYCFHECPDWGSELQERHRLLVDVVRLARRLGVEFGSVTPAARGPAGGAATPAAGSAPQLAAADAVRVGREQAAAIAPVPADRPAK